MTTERDETTVTSTPSRATSFATSSKAMSSPRARYVSGDTARRWSSGSDSSPGPSDPISAASRAPRTAGRCSAICTRCSAPSFAGAHRAASGSTRPTHRCAPRRSDSSGHDDPPGFDLNVKHRRTTWPVRLVRYAKVKRFRTTLRYACLKTRFHHPNFARGLSTGPRNHEPPASQQRTPSMRVREKPAQRST